MIDDKSRREGGDGFGSDEPITAVTDVSLDEAHFMRSRGEQILRSEKILQLRGHDYALAELVDKPDLPSSAALKEAYKNYSEGRNLREFELPMPLPYELGLFIKSLFLDRATKNGLDLHRSFVVGKKLCLYVRFDANAPDDDFRVVGYRLAGEPGSHFDMTVLVTGWQEFLHHIIDAVDLICNRYTTYAERIEPSESVCVSNAERPYVHSLSSKPPDPGPTQDLKDNVKYTVLRDILGLEKDDKQ